MKNIIKFAFAVLMLAAFASCEKPGPGPEPNEPETPELNENIKFTLEVSSVEATSAKIKVSHDGTTNDSWYAFATEDSNVNEAYAAKVVELTSEEGKIKGLKKQTSYNFPVNGLNPETEYTFIVFGITEDGTVFGKPASTKFTTKRGEVVMEKNPAWTVAYNGKATIGNQEFEHTITVTSTDKNKYFITAYDKDTYESNDIKALAVEELAYVKEVIAYYQQQPGYESITVQDMLFEGNGIDAMELTPGDWYAIAIGVDKDDELSGYYAVSEIITIQEEEPTEAYASWLGDWTFTGANGVAFDVTMLKGISNQSYRLIGWEGPESEGLDIPVMWSGEEEMWAVLTYNFGTFNFGDYGDGDIFILGCDGQYYYPQAELPICIGGFTEDGQRAAIGYSWKNEDESTTAITTMEYAAVFYQNGQIAGLGAITSTEEWPTFPIIITPREGAAPASADETNMSVQKFTQAPKPIKTYYQSYKNAIVR